MSLFDCGSIVSLLLRKDNVQIVQREWTFLNGSCTKCPSTKDGCFCEVEKRDEIEAEKEKGKKLGWCG